MHPKVGFAGGALGNGFEVFLGNRRDASVLLDGDHSPSPPLDGLAGHHATAAAEIQPTATGQLRGQQVHHRQPHPRGGGPGDLPRGAEEFAPATDAQGHGALMAAAR